MSQQEQTRLKVLNSVMVGRLAVGQEAEVLGISERHVRRILAAYQEEGAAALVHGNRGRRPANATSESAIAEVMRLAASRYPGTNHTHLSELLREREAWQVGEGCKGVDKTGEDSRYSGVLRLSFHVLNWRDSRSP